MTKGKSRDGISSDREGAMHTTVALVSKACFLDNPHALHTDSKRKVESNCLVPVR